MKTFRVLALEMGFYAGGRRRAGSEFDMEAECAEDGTPKLPRWVILATDASRRDYEKQRAADAAKAAEAAIVSSGTRFASKEKTFLDVMREGRGPVRQDAQPEAAAKTSSADAFAKAKKETIEQALGRGVGPSTPIS